MHLWSGPKFLGRDSERPTDPSWRPLSRQHSGSYADGEYFAVWPVFLDRQPHRRDRNNSRLGSSHPDALHPCNRDALGSRIADGAHQ